MISILSATNTFIIILILAGTLYALSKFADKLVENAVKLSKIWGLSKVVIGATIVSLGTTLPELSASTIAAVQGHGSFALGNAVGSVITNSSLILGAAGLFGNIPVKKSESQKLTILIGAILLMVIPSIISLIKTGQGNIPQLIGIIMLVCVPSYLFYIVCQGKKSSMLEDGINDEEKPKETVSTLIFFVLLFALLITVSAAILVNSAEVLAVRIGIPDAIIASTLVSFGTSVPELSTAIAAIKSKNGGLALGNVLGANILNILFVVGVSVTLTPGGIMVDKEFFNIHFIAMTIAIGIFSIFAYNTKTNRITKREGILMICVYAGYLIANFFSITN